MGQMDTTVVPVWVGDASIEVETVFKNRNVINVHYIPPDNDYVPQGQVYMSQETYNPYSGHCIDLLMTCESGGNKSEKDLTTWGCFY